MININLDRLPVDVTDHIYKFRQFLNVSWPEVENLMEFHDWDGDMEFLTNWLDVNWSILVEREILLDEGLLTSLSVNQSNIFLKNEKKKFTIQACLSETEKVNMPEINSDFRARFFGFCTKSKSGGFSIRPPFDTAELVTDSDKKIYSVPFESLEFYLVEYE